MKFLVVGLGSMGKRRIRNLHTLNENSIIGFDPRNDRRKEAEEKYGIKTFESLDDALNEKPTVMIISTPPDLHMKYAKMAISNNIHFFTEANIVKEGMKEVMQLLQRSKIVGVPSCTLRFHPIVLKINEILNNEDLGRPLTLLYHSGQYLPDWHPWEDINDFYVSKKETGGCREIVPFELEWLVKTFGPIKNTFAKKAKLSNLNAEIDDIYNILLTFENGMMGVVTIDVLSRVPFRQIKILTENGIILGDWSEKTIRFYHHKKGWHNYKVDTGKPEKGYIHGEGPYIAEMKGFLNLINNNENFPYSFEEDLSMLELLTLIEKSSEENIAKNV